VWIFHIVPDDTHSSAVWAAQRVPDDHITVIANQFIIKTMDLEDSDWYMASDNMHEVARRSGRWQEEKEAFSFLQVFGKDQVGQNYYVTLHTCGSCVVVT
jgi:dipeptidase